ncbi:MAG: hypothetical protein ACTSPD_07640 [Promethearchaeota archaeon]
MRNKKVKKILGFILFFSIWFLAIVGFISYFYMNNQVLSPLNTYILFLSISIYVFGLPIVLIYYYSTKNKNQYNNDAIFWLLTFCLIWLLVSMIIYGLFDFLINKNIGSLLLFLFEMILALGLLYLFHDYKKHPESYIKKEENLY